MIKYFLFFFICSLTLEACSQAASTTPNQASSTPAEKPMPVAPAAYASTKEGWLVDLDEAYAKSVKEGKPILANFTGSDWCGWCKRLDADVFTKPEFMEWAKKNVVLLEVDFPRRKQIPEKNRTQNAGMQQALQISGYPTIWLMELSKNPANGQYSINGLGKTGYMASAAQFIETIDKMSSSN